MAKCRRIRKKEWMSFFMLTICEYPEPNVFLLFSFQPMMKSLLGLQTMTTFFSAQYCQLTYVNKKRFLLILISLNSITIVQPVGVQPQVLSQYLSFTLGFILLISGTIDDCLNLDFTLTDRVWCKM